MRLRSAAMLGVLGLAWGGWTLGSHLLASRAVRRGARGGRRLALTFDDGPDESSTPAVLDILERHGVRASFFLIGRRAAAAPGLVQRMAAAGHDLGNHTWSHRSLWRSGPQATRQEIERGHEAIGRAAGRAPAFFRPPWGLMNAGMFAVTGRLGTPVVLWSAQPEGRRPSPAAAQLARCVADAAPGAIYDLHDADGVPGAGARLVAYLPGLIEALRRDGYALVPLSQLV